MIGMSIPSRHLMLLSGHRSFMTVSYTHLVTIEDIGVTGEGIGKIDGYTLFVKDTVIGDVVEVKIMKAKKNYGYARLMNIITPSKDRVTPECNIARQCGGCQLQAMSYAAQLKYKQKLVSDNLQRIGGLTEGVDYEMCDILGMDTPFRYRNKAQYPVGCLLYTSRCV